jgi:uncharacterized membrane-anchored protein
MAEGEEQGVRLFAGGAPLAVHPLRARAANEVHARPFDPLCTPSRVYVLAYLADVAAADRDREALARFCAARGLPQPDGYARHHRVSLGALTLRWERHTEFVTHTFASGEEVVPPFHRAALSDAGLPGLADAPGPVIAAIHLALVGESDAGPLDVLFDGRSLCVSEVEGGCAIVATDFRQDAHGFTRILILDRGLSPPRSGALAQSLLDIETYRTLALLGLPKAQSFSPELRRVEEGLRRVIAKTSAEDLETSRSQLERLIDLAAETESMAADASYRFGATRAYSDIVLERLAALGEEPAEGRSTWAAFLTRRVLPAVRTCEAVEARIDALSHNLTRTAELLRTRVSIAMEAQNRDLLGSMNRRTRLQLRLQQTVEGLSVAAVSYYAVGLLAYLFKGAEDRGWIPSATLATALAVPLVVLLVWSMVRRIRRVHGEAE